MRWSAPFWLSLSVAIGLSLLFALVPLPAAHPAARASVAEPPARSAGVGPAPQLVPVRGAAVESIGNAGLYIALDKGYFAEQGLDVDLGRFAGTDAYMAALATGELDFGTTDVNAGLFNIMGRGIDIRFVADRGSTPPGQGWIGWMVRTDLADRVRDYSDLRGLRIAVGFEGAYQHPQVGRSLERGGLTFRDVDLTVVPIVESNPALANNAIDATIGLEPFNTIAVNQRFAVRWRGMDEVVPNSQVVILTYSQRFAGQRDLAQRWMTAYLKGVRDYNTALRHGPNRAEIVEILTRQTPLKDPSLWQQEPRATPPSGVVWPAIDPDGRMNVASIQADLDWFVREGMVRTSVDLSRYVDTSFAEAAAAQLGPYTR
jgi:NitT/TauT family transport system substrate-binding protein